ncbi:MAG: PTS fructose transporter subunit IIA [Deltaproteobacteria bacterium CG07_land_8_20_14_0_80_38_7]|nr:MAG: PTS fructose transporter subunit IIA [Deltaproteobacteria bacterium CG07_land_8_20_14_0_80_38_7]
MIGIVVVAHLGIANEMVSATQQIIPESKNMVGVSVQQNEAPETIRNKITTAINSINNTDGILILTDMFGGTPSNVCLSFLSEPNIEVISGVNLPMLVKLASFGQTATFKETTAFIQEYGQRNIVIASDVLTGHSKK